MGLSARLERLVPDLAATMRRFPGSFVWSLLLAVVVNIGISHRELPYRDDIILAGAAAFLATGAMHLFAEGRRLDRVTSLVLSLAAGALGGLLIWYQAELHVSGPFLFCGLIALTTVAAHLRRDATQGALWFFNLRYGLAAILAILAGLAFTLGLVTIISSLNFLFGLDPMPILEDRIAAIAATLVAPIYGLSLMPRDLDTALDVADHRGSPLERGVSVLVNYILVPVVVVYALILHAYAVKIALTGELPQGEIGTMVAIYAVGGTGVWLIAWPWRETGSKLLRLFMKGWFWFTIIPSLLLVIAIWRRVAEYGFTPNRYGIALIALWAVLVTLYLALRRRAADMRVIIGAMAALLLIASFGPQGAYGTTIRSQTNRLITLLAENGMWQDGKIKLPVPILRNEVQSTGASIIDALRDVYGLANILTLFPDEARPAVTTQWAMGDAISKKLGFTYDFTNYEPKTEVPAVDFLTDQAIAQDLQAGARLFGPFETAEYYYEQAVPPKMSAWFRGSTLTITTDGQSWQIAIPDLVRAIQAGVVTTGSQPPIRMNIAPGVTLVIVRASAELYTPPRLKSATLWVIWQKQPPATP